MLIFVFHARFLLVSCLKTIFNFTIKLPVEMNILDFLSIIDPLYKHNNIEIQILP